METESKIKAPCVIQASADNAIADKTASDLSSTSSHDEGREYPSNCGVQSSPSSTNANEKLSPLISKQIKWKIPTKAFTTSSKISGDNLLPKKKVRLTKDRND